MTRRKLHILNCWQHLPRNFPSNPQSSIGLENGQLAFHFFRVYQAKRSHPTFNGKKPRIRTTKQGRMMYCNMKARWETHDVYDKPISLHCGEYFHVEVGRTYLPCRIEFDHEWYVVFNKSIFHLHPNTDYLVRGI